MDPLSLRGVSLERLQSFLLVASAGGIARAAPGEPVRQSQLSRQVRELEAALGCELFERRGRAMKLTVSGEAGQRLVRELDQGLRDLADRTEVQRVALGAGDSTLQWLILPRLGELRGAMEGMVLSVGACSADEVVDGLKSREIDVGVLRFAEAGGDLKVLQVGRVAYGVFRAAGTGPLPLAVPSTERGLEAPLATLEAPLLRCESFPQVAQAVRSGAFAGVLPLFAREALPAPHFRVERVPALDTAATPLAIAWHPRTAERRPRVHALVQRLKVVLAAALASGVSRSSSAGRNRQGP